MSRSPQLTKGAIIGFDLFNPLASVIVFDYNPTTISRSVQARSGQQGGGARSEVLRLTGPPTENIRMKVHIDAADQLEQGKDGGQVAHDFGVYPQLSALEMLLYPKTLQVAINTALAATGSLEILPPEAPFTLLIWGPKRVVPVRLSGFTIEEQRFDENLNPILAEVDLDLRVLTYDDFPLLHPGWFTFLAHQVVKETMAVVGSVGSIQNIGSIVP